MTQIEYETAVATFLKTKGVTRCPTVCAAPTQGTVAEPDRAAYRHYVEERETARVEKLKSLQRMPLS